MKKHSPVNIDVFQQYQWNFENCSIDIKNLVVFFIPARWKSRENFPRIFDLPVSSGLVQLVKIWKNNRKSVNRFKVYWWILLWNDSWVQKKGTACKRRNRYEYQGHCTSVQHRDRKNIEMGKYCIFCLCDGWSKIIQVLYKKILYLRFTLLMTND